MTFYERYEQCCKERGILPKSQFAADRLGCNKSSISAFAKSGKAPQGSIIANAAKMLDISSDYLLGIVDVPNPVKFDLTPQELDILSNIQKLNTETQQTINAMLQGLLLTETYKKSIKKPAD